MGTCTNHQLLNKIFFWSTVFYSTFPLEIKFSLHTFLPSLLETWPSIKRWVYHKENSWYKQLFASYSMVGYREACIHFSCRNLILFHWHEQNRNYWQKFFFGFFSPIEERISPILQGLINKSMPTLFKQEW